MSEPILERLIRFTPDAGELDRDALLFAAGRSSARPSRAWMMLATLLASTQTLSLVLLWPHPTPPAGNFALPVAAVPEPPVTFDLRTAESRETSGPWSARRSLTELETEDRPAGNVTLIESGPPLRAAGPLPPSLLN
jgi:hypothetical protein